MESQISQNTDLKNVLCKKDEEPKPKVEYKPSDNMQDLLSMMDNESKSINNKSWSKINRSNKITLLEDFITREILEKNLDEKQSKTLNALLIKSLNNNLLNKQSDIIYDSLQNIIIEIKTLKFDKETLIYSLITQKNDVKVNTKTRSKTNIDKLLNNSKKRR
jgi:hypothetical protein